VGETKFESEKRRDGLALQERLDAGSAMRHVILRFAMKSETPTEKVSLEMEKRQITCFLSNLLRLFTRSTEFEANAPEHLDILSHTWIDA
jgi:hypothetical protein